MNRIQKISKLIKIATSDNPDRAIQQGVFDILVADGSSEDMAATVVSNIAIEDLKILLKKIDSCREEYPYGWKHSCGESFFEFDSPGDPCPSCGEEGGWTYFDKEINGEES